jgi:hypothetical protein
MVPVGLPSGLCHEALSEVLVAGLSLAIGPFL